MIDPDFTVGQYALSPGVLTPDRQHVTPAAHGPLPWPCCRTGSGSMPTDPAYGRTRKPHARPRDGDNYPA
jgi:hypothetical protein